MKYLPDTQVLIGLIKRQPSIAARVKAHDVADFGLSAVVLQELYFGASKSSERYREGNFRNIAHLAFPLLPFNEQNAREAGHIRAALEARGTPIGPYDVLIAAQALTRQLVLITHNTREFARVPGLRVEDWL